MTTRKELKDQAKLKKSPMGVFQIRNLTSGKVLIDNSVDMTARWNRHKAELKFGSHQNKALLADWKEQGEENFVFEVLSELEAKEDTQANYSKELATLEKLILDELNLSDDSRY